MAGVRIDELTEASELLDAHSIPAMVSGQTVRVAGALFRALAQQIADAGDETLSDAIAAVIGSAPADLNTLEKIASALGGDPDFLAAVYVEIGRKQNSLGFNPLNAATVVGSVGLFAMTSAPTGWIKANGAAVSRTSYSALFSAIGTTWGAGDGSTTFNIPDLRGEFFRGYDDGRGVDSGRSMGNVQGDQMDSLYAKIWIGGAGSALGTYALRDTSSIPSYSTDTGVQSSTNLGGYGSAVNYATAVTRKSIQEVRPRNQALLACIRYAS